MKTCKFAMAVGVVLMATSALAQQQRETQKPVVNGRTGANSADAKLAACIMIGNEGEITLGKLAEQHAKDEDVKKFAKQMVEDHTKFWQQLARFAPEGQRGESTRQANSTDQQSRAVAATQFDGQTGGLNFLQLKREMSQECLNMVRNELDDKKGTDFDKCYMGQQVGAHMEMLSALKVIQRHASSPEFRDALDKGIETTESHLKDAKDLLKSLEKDSSS